MPVIPLTLFAALSLAFQIAPGTNVESVLPGLIANGQRYAAALPSLTCEESVDSRHLKGEKVKEQVTLQGSLHIQRTGQDLRPFEEIYRWTSRNAQPVPEGKIPSAPYFLRGTFINGLGFSNSKNITCFNAALQDLGTTLILNLTYKPESAANPACDQVAPGRSSHITIDRATGHVTRLESSMPAQVSEQRKQPFFVAIDYQPTLLGDETFWLPVHVESHNPADDRRMTATYANCRRFAASMKIVGDTTVVPQ